MSTALPPPPRPHCHPRTPGQLRAGLGEPPGASPGLGMEIWKTLPIPGGGRLGSAAEGSSWGWAGAASPVPHPDVVPALPQPAVVPPACLQGIFKRDFNKDEHREGKPLRFPAPAAARGCWRWKLGVLILEFSSVDVALRTPQNIPSVFEGSGKGSGQEDGGKSQSLDNSDLLWLCPAWKGSPKRDPKIPCCGKGGIWGIWRDPTPSHPIPPHGVPSGPWGLSCACAWGAAEPSPACPRRREGLQRDSREF